VDSERKGMATGEVLSDESLGDMELAADRGDPRRNSAYKEQNGREGKRGGEVRVRKGGCLSWGIFL